MLYQEINTIRQWHIVKSYTLKNKKKQEMHKRYAEILIKTMDLLEEFNIEDIDTKPNTASKPD